MSFNNILLNNAIMYGYTPLYKVVVKKNSSFHSLALIYLNMESLQDNQSQVIENYHVRSPNKFIDSPQKFLKYRNMWMSSSNDRKIDIKQRQEINYPPNVFLLINVRQRVEVVLHRQQINLSNGNIITHRHKYLNPLIKICNTPTLISLLSPSQQNNSRRTIDLKTRKENCILQY